MSTWLRQQFALGGGNIRKLRAAGSMFFTKLTPVTLRHAAPCVPHVKLTLENPAAKWSQV